MLGLSLSRALALAFVAALAGAEAALLAVRRGWSSGLGVDLDAGARELPAAIVPSLELISLQQAREIRARRTALH